MTIDTASFHARRFASMAEAKEACWWLPVDSTGAIVAGRLEQLTEVVERCAKRFGYEALLPQIIDTRWRDQRYGASVKLRFPDGMPEDLRVHLQDRVY